MPLLEAPTHFDDESSPENSLAAELGAAGNAIPAVGQLRIHTPEPGQAPAIVRRNTFRAVRLPTIRLHNPHTFAQVRARAAAVPRANTVRETGFRADIFAELEAEAELNEAESWLRVGLAPSPVVNLLPVTLPAQVAEPQLDELLRRVTQRTDLHNVETVRLRVISAITVSLSRLAMFLPRLQHLDLNGSVLNSLRDLGCGLINLIHLNVSNCGLTSFDGISGMPSVREIIADGNMIERVGPLSQLALLQHLSAQNNRIGDLNLLTFLAMCPNLTEVEFQGNPVCHLPLYRHTLHRNIRTLRLIDGSPPLPQVEENTIENVPSAPSTLSAPMALSNTDNSNDTERVAMLNRRNTLLCRQASTASIASTQSSLSTASSPANTATDNEALSSLSSEYQVPELDITVPVPIPVPVSSPAVQHPSAAQSETSFSSSDSDSAPVAHTDTYLSASLASLTVIRCLRRPATAPTENSSPSSIGLHNSAANRPASASVPIQYQHPVLPSGAASSSIVAGSILDLVRQHRRRRRYGQAWLVDNIESTSSGSSSVASNQSSTAITDN